TCALPIWIEAQSRANQTPEFLADAVAELFETRTLRAGAFVLIDGAGGGLQAVPPIGRPDLGDGHSAGAQALDGGGESVLHGIIGGNAHPSRAKPGDRKSTRLNSRH